MSDIDDLLERALRSEAGTDDPDRRSAPGRPPAAHLTAVLREGRRRRQRRQIVVGGVAGAIAVAVIAGALAYRSGGGGTGPADTSDAPTVSSTATTVGSSAAAPSTVPGPASPSAPGTVAASATTTPAGGAVDERNAGVAFVAVSSSGRVEAWARSGLVRSVESCSRPSSHCHVSGAAVGGGHVWFVETNDEPAFSTLFRASLTGSDAPTRVAGSTNGEWWTDVTVTADGSDVYLLASVDGPLRHVGPDGAPRPSIGTAVTAFALSGDGRIAYAERGGATGATGAGAATGAGVGPAVVVRTLATGAERRIALAPAPTGDPAMPVTGRITDVRWSPDHRRLLVLVNPSEGAVWGVLDPTDGAPLLRRLSKHESVPACWTGATTVAVGGWAVSYERDTPGPIDEFDATTGSVIRSIGGGFAEIDDLQCRGDGAVVLVQRAAPTATGGDLLVVGAAGTATRLGLDYGAVHGPGWGPAPTIAAIPSGPTTATTATASTTPTGGTTAPGAAAAPNADAFVATTAAGTLEVWAPKGKLVAVPTLPACATAAPCRTDADVVTAAAVTDRSVWFANGLDGSVWRAPLDGSAPVLAARVDGTVRALTVARDDATAWWVRYPSGDGTGVLERRANGATTMLAADARGVALSPDGTRLAYSTYTFTGATGGPTTGAEIGRLVVRDLATGAERAQPWRARPGYPPALDGLRWSPDGTRLLVAESWEGSRDFVVAADLSASLDAPAYVAPGGANAASCWLDAGTIARGLWPIVYAEGPSQTSDVVAGDLRTGLQAPFGVNVYGDTLACRSDGSVALVDHGTAYDRPGDLVVVRRGGTRTVLGKGYRAVFPG